MADTKLSALTAATVLASVDEFVVVDKSDTTMAASGTTKRLTLATLLADPVFIAALDGRYVAQSPPWTTTFVPIIDQGATTNIAKTVNKSQWHYDGDMVEWEAFITLNAAGTTNQTVRVGLPVSALVALNGSMGTAVLIHSSIRYVCNVETLDINTVLLGADQAGAAGNLGWGIFPNLPLAATDQIHLLVRYRWR